jgi:hypothetical protein
VKPSTILRSGVADQAERFGEVHRVGQGHFDFQDEREWLAALWLARASACHVRGGHAAWYGSDNWFVN